MTRPTIVLRVFAAAVAAVALAACSSPAEPAPAPSETSAPPTTAAPEPTATSAEPTPEPTPEPVPSLLNWYGELPTDDRGCPVPPGDSPKFQPVEPDTLGAAALPDTLCLYKSSQYATFVILPVAASDQFVQQVTDWLGSEWVWSEPIEVDGLFHVLRSYPESATELYKYDGSINGGIVATEGITESDLGKGPGLSAGVGASTFGRAKPDDNVFVAAIWW